MSHPQSIYLRTRMLFEINMYICRISMSHFTLLVIYKRQKKVHSVRWENCYLNSQLLTLNFMIWLSHAWRAFWLKVSCFIFLFCCFCFHSLSAIIYDDAVNFLFRVRIFFCVLFLVFGSFFLETWNNVY